MADALAGLLQDLVREGGRLFVVSNRGPITFEHHAGAPGGLTAARGSGGLVTALAELGSHAPVTWVAAALTDADREVATGLRSGQPNARVRQLLDELLPNQDVQLQFADLPGEIYAPYYEVIANPFLWFLQHEMFALPYEPNVDRELLNAWRTGYRPANDRLADAALDAAAGVERPVFLLQDYHLYLAAARSVRSGRTP